jgi:acetyl-CoA carboxylase carboxyltransferase component
VCDAGSFVEYGALTLAAQRSRRSLEELIRVSPADGVVAGIGTVNAADFGAEQARCMVVAYDASVLAGTQGLMNHKKQDRLFEVAERSRLPLVLFAEGGGGRPGDTDVPIRPTLDVSTFATFAGLSGLVPLVGVVSGRCFAGNAALLGCCDVIIATENSNIGMGGPVMIEGAGLGACAPEDVGPIAIQSQNGVVDVRVADEAEATALARRYLSYFQGSLTSWSCEDQRLLRRVIPENRLRVYEMRRIIELLADTGSVLELRRAFGVGMITALIRIEGRPFGVIANEPRHLSGAIDAAAADKGARFLQLCDAFDLPVLSLLDTPGFMVGPEAEKTALVRHVSRLFVVASSLTVPLFTVVVRKAYGLGAMSVAGGSLHAPVFTGAWPTAEFGAMGLEGAVLLAMKKQLEAIADPEQRRTTVRSMANALREEGKAVNAAFHLEFDAVIDPAETRSVIARAANAVAPPPPRTGKKRSFVDTW